MDWTEIQVKVNVSDIELASNICCMVVPYGFYIEDYSNLEQDALEIAHIDLIDEDLLKKDRNNAIIHIYIQPTENPLEAIDFIKDRFENENIKYSIETNGINETDWANNWKKYFVPTEIGDTLLILPEWYERPDTDRKILSIDPGAAFGTGTHTTTKLCLKVLEKSIKKDANVLDIGSGSGILSIASLLFGAKSAIGVDIDSLAVKTALENGAKNGFFPPKYDMVNGDLADKISGKYDVVIANIVADVIIRLCENVKDFINRDGKFITSGIIDNRANEVQEAIEKSGFIVENRFEENGWVCIVAKLK